MKATALCIHRASTAMSGNGIEIHALGGDARIL